MANVEKIKLGDSQEYEISTFNVGDLIDVEKKFGSFQLDATKLESTIYWFWLALKKKHKDITLEKLYDLIDTPFMTKGGLVEVIGALTRVNEWDKLPKNDQAPKAE